MATELGIKKPNKSSEKRRIRKKRRKVEKLSKGVHPAKKGRDPSLQGEGRNQVEALEDNENITGLSIEYISAPRDFSLEVNQANGTSTIENGVEPEKDVKPDLDPDEEMGSYGGLGLGAGAGVGSVDAEPVVGSANKDFEGEFNRIFDHFVAAESLLGSQVNISSKVEKREGDGEKIDDDSDNDMKDSDDGSDLDEDGISKKKRKLRDRLKIAELKQICSRPEVVEVWDVTATDPKILVFLKAYRNSVPVPRHWSQKRKYLQGKRGIEKPPFKLPDFIEATGISMMRQAYQEKEEAKKLKQKQRDRMQPKLGKMDIDYTILHDAFFKYQTKPSLTRMGDLYYEGKEFEARVKDIKPGVLSVELQKALGMSDGAPPPWLINMQRYGPPPSYPSLKISGLNAPIPPGTSFGYHPGGWGKPPVDEEGKPLYGDVFGQYEIHSDSDIGVDKMSRWGDLDSDAEESSEEEEVDEDASEGQSAMDEDAITTGTESVASGFASSLPSGVETPDMIDLRKVDRKQKQLYTVLEQKQAAVGQTNVMGSDHVYVLPGAENALKEKWPVGPTDKKRLEGLPKMGNADVDITLDPEELEGLDEAAIKSLYEQKLTEARDLNQKDDFSDMVAAKAREQKRKIAARETAKKKETFKF